MMIVDAYLQIYIEKKSNKQIKHFTGMYEGISASAISCWLLLDNVVAHFAFSPDYTEEGERKEHIH